MLSGKSVGHGFDSRYLHWFEMDIYGGRIGFLTAFEYGKRRGLQPI